jgi:hypothetical protein
MAAEDPAMSACRDHLRSAADHLRSAASTAADHVVPPEVRSHLRSAAREALLAGVAAIDAAEERGRKTDPAPAPAADVPAAAPVAG